MKSAWVFEVQDLITDKVEVIHSRRILLYRGDMDGKVVSPELLRSAEHLESEYQSVESITNIRQRAGQLELEIEWEGLPHVHDRTWEPLSQIFQDVSDLLTEYLQTAGSKILKTKAVSLISKE